MERKWEKSIKKVQSKRQVYTTTEDGVLVQIVDLGFNTTCICDRRTIQHWMLTMMYQESAMLFEANYANKMEILKEVGKLGKFGLEIFPPEYDVVEEETATHLWELEDLSTCIFKAEQITSEPSEKFQKLKVGEQEIQYYVKQHGIMKYLFLKAEQEMLWREKQDCKNKIMGEECTAVEVIMEELVDKPYTCLVCFPKNFFLDFGI